MSLVVGERGRQLSHNCTRSHNARPTNYTPAAPPTCPLLNARAQIQCAVVVAMAALMCAAKHFIDVAVRPSLLAAAGASRAQAKRDAKAAKAAAAEGSTGAAGSGDQQQQQGGQQQQQQQQQQQDEGKKGGGEGGEAEGAKQSTWDVLRSSSRIRDLAVMVMGFGVCNKLFAWSWKAEMRALYPDVGAYATAMGDVASWTVRLPLLLRAFFVCSLCVCSCVCLC